MEENQDTGTENILPQMADVDALKSGLNLLQKIDLAEESLAKDGGIAQGEAKKRLAKWLE